MIRDSLNVTLHRAIERWLARTFGLPGLFGASDFLTLHHNICTLSSEKKIKKIVIEARLSG